MYFKSQKWFEILNKMESAARKPLVGDTGHVMILDDIGVCTIVPKRVIDFVDFCFQIQFQAKEERELAKKIPKYKKFIRTDTVSLSQSNRWNVVQSLC